MLAVPSITVKLRHISLHLSSRIFSINQSFISLSICHLRRYDKNDNFAIPPHSQIPVVTNGTLREYISTRLLPMHVVKLAVGSRIRLLATRSPQPLPMSTCHSLQVMSDHDMVAVLSPQ